MDKLIVNERGEAQITNDGATILKLLDISKMLIVDDIDLDIVVNTLLLSKGIVRLPLLVVCWQFRDGCRHDRSRAARRTICCSGKLWVQPWEDSNITAANGGL